MPIQSTCLFCGQLFPRPPSNPGRYCSRHCRNLAQHRRAERTCIICKQIFWVHQSRLKASKSGDVQYCSQTCRPTHTLLTVDPESRHGVCALCGPVQLWKQGGRWGCGRRPPGQQYVWVHQLVSVDPMTRAAVCTHCGPIRAWRVTNGLGGGFPAAGANWVCSNGQRERTLRNSPRRFLKASCERCGFVPEDPCQLDINHRDGHPENDDPANFETLCANCHRLISKWQRADWQFTKERWIKPVAIRAS